jgi:hypothetical protein
MTRGGVAKAVLGGWSMGGILQLQAGSPFTLTTSRDIANVGTTTRLSRAG